MISGLERGEGEESERESIRGSFPFISTPCDRISAPYVTEEDGIPPAV